MADELPPFLQRLADFGAYTPPERPHRTVNGTGGPVPPAGDPQAVRYASAALDSEARRVAETPEGQRNDALNRAAFRMKQLVDNGWLGEQDAFNALVDAGQTAGLGYPEAERTVLSGLGSHSGGRVGVELHEGLKVAPAVTVDPQVAFAGGEVAGQSHGVASVELPRQLKGGGMYIHSALTAVPALWGDDDEVLWAEGEPLIITGPTGVGKTTLGTHVLAARMGLLDESVLGYPVAPGRKKTLVLAMDRPRQIQRAMARLLRQYPEDVLEERLIAWEGPPPMDIGRHPHVLHQLAETVGADTVVLDSLKDAALKLSDEETGQGLSRAMNYCVTNGIQVLAYHHQTKRSQSPDAKPKTLADVYGSSWITAGAGSVICVWANAGDLIAEFIHLKQPAAVVGPMAIGFDHTVGRVFLYEGMSERDRLLDLLASGPQTPQAVASWLTPGAPDRAAIAKAKRRLDKLVETGRVVLVDSPAPGDRGPDGRLRGREATRYRLAGHEVTPKTQPKHIRHDSSAWNDIPAGQTEDTTFFGEDQLTEDTKPKHTEDTRDVNPQVGPKTHRSTPPRRATESTHTPPPKGGRAAGLHAGTHAYQESPDTELEVEVCHRCHRPAERFIPAPDGVHRWCPRCAYPTEAPPGVDTDDEED